MKYCIDQPGCLGDTLFVLNFAEQLSKEAEVYWHISPVFWENGINRIKSPAIMGPNIPRRIQGSDKVFDLCGMCNRNSPELMKSNALENNFNFPYLYDESQQIAKDYDAACTPDFYLFDSVPNQLNLQTQLS